MLPSHPAPLADLPLAHPITQPHILPVAPLVAAAAGAALVLLVALAWPRTKHQPPGEPAGRDASWSGGLSPLHWPTRVIGVALLCLAIGAGRLGTDDELENLAPALVVGAAWPLLVLASIVIGPVWRWFDPWDALARLLTRRQLQKPWGNVWPAAFFALVWVWYLSAYRDPLGPRSVGTVLAVYTVLTVAGCLAVGRARWLASAEPFGIVLSWMALLPRGRLGAWWPPAGADALLGVLAGGVLFGAVRRSELWGDLNAREHAEVVAAVGVLGFCLTGATTFALSTGRALPNVRSAVIRAAVPAVAAVIVAVAMDRNRLFTSVQLLPGLIGDPFGEGWDLLGRADAGLDPAPLGTGGLLAAQLVTLLIGHLIGALLLARQLPRRARAPGAVPLAISAGASVIALASP